MKMGIKKKKKKMMVMLMMRSRRITTMMMMLSVKEIFVRARMSKVCTLYHLTVANGSA